jgi:hypothetical protein
MNIKLHLEKLFYWILVLWILSLLIGYFLTNRVSPKEVNKYLSPLKQDTIVAAIWQFHEPDFQFYVKHVTEGGGKPVSAFLSVHLNSNDRSYYIHDCHRSLDLQFAKPERLFSNVFWFPDESGGNYSRSSYFLLFIVDSFPRLLGPVSGYDKIHKVFYVNYVSEYGESNSDNKVDTMHIIFTGDTLIYRFIDGGF